MTCNCEFMHRATSLTTGGLLTVTNPNNIANLMPFNLVLCLNPNAVILGAPVDYTITVNGTDVALKNKYGLPISTDHLEPRRLYRGRYIVPTTGDPYVILLNTPCDIAFAMSSASAAATTTGGE